MHLIFQLRTLAGAPMALLVLAGPAAGQRPAPAPTPAPTPPSAAAPIGRLTGVVVDSIHGGPLTRATVRVGTTGRSGVTSLGGIFVIDSVLAGEHVVRVTQTLLGTDCPPATRMLGPAMFAGRVLDAESGQPAARVRVTFVYTELAAGTDI